MQNRKGFTLIELLVVIAIIGILASLGISSFNGALSRARDAQRISDLREIKTALERYYLDYGTYRVSGSGWCNASSNPSCTGGGHGWLGYENGTSYKTSVTRVLYNEGYLSEPLVDDPIQSPGYMIYTCEGGEVYALSATLENPSSENEDYIQTTCNGTGGNGTYTRYGKNYAVANKTY